MCRSVMVKGIEALLAEALLARGTTASRTRCWARWTTCSRAGVGSLSRYMIAVRSSMANGGRKRCARRRGPCGGGVEPLMSAACAERQEWAWRNKRAFD